MALSKKRGVTLSPTKVLITGGDPTVGQTVASALGAAGYDARWFLNGSFFEATAEQFEGTRLIVLGPRLSPQRRAALLGKVRSTPALSGLPLLELDTSLNGTETVPIHHVPWPCSLEVLENRIESVLPLR